MTSRTPAILLVSLAMLASACGDSARPPETLPGGVTTIASSEGLPDPTPTTELPAGGPLRAQITTEDGVVLDSRTFVGGRDWVVLAHMRPADMSSWFDFGERLAAEGYTALVFDFRGYGESEGAPDEFNVGTDVTAAVDFAFARGAERVFVIGASMGGTGAVVAAAALPVSGVATISAAGEFFGADAVAAVGDVTAPKLFMAAADDAPYPSVVAELLAGASDPKAEHIFSGNSHGTDLFTTHGEELTTILLDFLRNA